MTPPENNNLWGLAVCMLSAVLLGIIVLFCICTQKCDEPPKIVCPAIYPEPDSKCEHVMNYWQQMEIEGYAMVCTYGTNVDVLWTSNGRAFTIKDGDCIKTTDSFSFKGSYVAAGSICAIELEPHAHIKDTK